MQGVKRLARCIEVGNGRSLFEVDDLVQLLDDASVKFLEVGRRVSSFLWIGRNQKTQAYSMDIC